MYLLGLGLVLLVLKWQAVGPVANLSWWWVAVPFVAAVFWWQWADWSGYTKKKAMQRDEQRRRRRAGRHYEALGKTPPRDLPSNRRR